MKRANYKLLGEILVEEGFIKKEDLEIALERKKREKKMLGEILLEMGSLKEEELVQVLSLQFGSSYLPLDNYEIDFQIVKRIPQDIIEKYKIIPIDIIGNILTIVTFDPSNLELEELENVLGFDIQVFICTKSEFERALKKIKQNVSSG